MTERDAFEVRFHAAVRDYAGRGSSDLDPVELAHRIAAREPRRHGFAAALAWRGLAVPRVAWILLLLAGLVVAMVAGMLVVGSQPVPKLPAVLPPVGTTFICPPGSTPDTPGPVDQARPPQDARLVMAFDRRTGRLVALAGVDDAVETWTFDVCTNTWTRMHPSREPFGWVGLVYDVDSDLTIGVADCRDCVLEPTGTVWIYDRAANTWNEKGAAPTGVTELVYDSISGLVVALGDEGDPYTPRKELWSYDVETGTWTPIRQSNTPTFTVLTYDVSVDRIIAYGPTVEDPESPDREIRLFDVRTGTWSRSAAVTPGVWDSGVWGAPPAIAYDEAAERTVVFGGSLATYDASADRWEMLIDGTDRDPSDWLPSSMVYDSVNRRLVGTGRGVIVAEGGVVALDLVTRKWTVLLEPGKVQPTPSTK